MSKTGNRQRNQVPLAEWIFAAIGAALVAASIAILLQNAAEPDSPPRLSVHVASIEKSGDQFLVIMDVANHGGSTAADARVEAELRQNGAVIERSETTLDFVPPKSRRRAGLFFSRDPNAKQLTLRASSYREP